MEVWKLIRENWYKIPDKIRFLIIGGINAAISYAIFATAVFLLGAESYQTWKIQACVILQWSLSSVFSYFNQKFFVFGTQGNYLKEYLKCCSTWAISYLLNVIILEVLIRFAIKNIYISQFISIFIVSIVTYILFKYFAFRKEKE